MNEQKIEKVEYHPEGKLEVFKIWKTLQGEGPLTGTPAVFVRLAGCVLSCHNCDTDYSSKRTTMEVSELMNMIDRHLRKGLVVLTGGEPLRQNIGPLVTELLSVGRDVQIETNGVLRPWDLPWQNSRLHVVCSPKTPKVDPSFLRNPKVNWKYVLKYDQVDSDDGLPSVTLGGLRPARPDWSVCNSRMIWVQPEDCGNDTTNKVNRDACVKSCMRFGYRLSLQTHKILGLE